MARFLVLTLSIAFLSGCQNDGPDVVRLKVARIEQKPDTREKDRILAALVVEKDKAWSFYMAGPESAVEAHAAKFQQFLDSIKFGDKPPMTWTTPDGWQQLPGNEFRLATLKTDAEPKSLDVTIVGLPGETFDLLGNVNRWRRQLSLGPVAKGELGDMAAEQMIDGRKGTLVKLVGRLAAKGPGMMPPMMPPAMPPKTPPVDRPQGGDGLTYELPKGWTRVAPKNAMIREQFAIVEGGGKAEATIVVLPGGAGGDVPNVQRWRGQIQLPPVAEAELRKAFLPLNAAGVQATFVDLENFAMKGDNRILGVIVPTAEKTYFLKLMGPSEVVGSHKERFQAFAKSLKIQ